MRKNIDRAIVQWITFLIPIVFVLLIVLGGTKACYDRPNVPSDQEEVDL